MFMFSKIPFEEFWLRFIKCFRCCWLLTLLLALCTFDINSVIVGKHDEQF